MASKEGNTIRFAVGTPDEYRSAIWRLWAKKNDVYLAAIGLGGSIKLSLHHTGIWRLAWTQESGILAHGSQDRVEKRWSRPPEFRPGWTQGASVVVPYTRIVKPFVRVLRKDDTKVIWSPTPNVDHEYHFVIAFVSPPAPKDSWRDVMQHNLTLLGSLELKDGDKVILCRREVLMNEKGRAYINYASEDMNVTFDSKPSDDDIEASLFSHGTDEFGRPRILDMPLSWDNVRIDKNKSLAQNFV